MSANVEILSTPEEVPIIISSMDQPTAIGDVTATPVPAGSNPILHQVSGKHQMLPLVYIQTQPAPKINTVTTTNNVILPQIQLQNLATIQPKPAPGGSVLLGKAPIVLQKANTLPKNGVAYLLKPVSKPPENVIANRLPLSTLSKIKSDSAIQMLNNPNKIMIAPMPSVTSNRLPATITTNSVQSKISLLPFMPKPKGKYINFKIEGGRIRDEIKLLDGDLTITAVDKPAAESPLNDEEKAPPPPPPKIFTPEKSDENEDTNADASKLHPNTKEVKIHTSEPLPTVTPIQTTPAPTKRSRKSTLCLRKDNHSIELEIMTNKKPREKEEKRVEVEANSTATKTLPTTDFNFNNMVIHEIAEMLHWDAGVGVLPETNLQFIMNEFGFLEYINKDDNHKLSNGKVKKEKKEKKERQSLEAQEEMRCIECGCFGMATEFINPKYCSVDCMNMNTGKRSALNNQPKTAYRKRSLDSNSTTPPASVQGSSSLCNKKRKLENGDVKEPSSDDDSSIITNMSHDRNPYPWHCRKNGFSWSKYLGHINAIGAPVKLFKDPFPYNRNGFRPGMKLEGIDPQHPSYFCVLSVTQVQGYRLQLHFDGYPATYDFWVDADSMDIFPAGFCEKHEHVLHPPPNFPDFNWNAYLKATKSTAAPKQLFASRTGSLSIFPTGFRSGMKLEAVDRKNTSLICVATAKDLLDNRILVHFDSWDDIYDYWAEPSSPYIHPVGWCDRNGHSLTPPNDYEDPENFTWERYLKETNSVAAPIRSFKQRPVTGFKKGMRLECVDKRVPQLIRAASVVAVSNHKLRIAFDGWPDKYSYWVDDDSPDIHPVGWCQKTGHRLEPPLTPDDVYDFLECNTIGCRGVGNILGAQFTSHTSQKHCPYFDENLDVDRGLPDRIRTPDRKLEEAVPVSREPKCTKSPQKKYETDPTKTEWLDENNTKKTSFTTKSSLGSNKIKLLDDESNPEEIKMRKRHSKFYHSLVKSQVYPSQWTCDKVCEYVNSLPFIKEKTEAFRVNAIDGDSFLMLTRQDLVQILGFKLGPAIALYNCILLLRKNTCI